MRINRLFVVAFSYAVLTTVLLATAAGEDPNPPSIHSNRGAWPIRRQWNRTETLHYAQWVENIYQFKTEGTVEQRTAKLVRVMTDPEMNLLEQRDFLGAGSNPQLAIGIIQSMHNMIDCGKFTAFMPAYYAYRRALPWMTTYVASGGGNVRTAPSNTPSGAASSFESGSPGAFFMEAVGGFSSGNYRVNINGQNSQMSDTVPVAITREFLMPGCINYTDGHCLFLARVDKYGELHFLNCSTTDSRDIFTYNGMNTVAGITPRGSDVGNEWHCCYQGVRVLRYPLAVTNASGEVIRVRRRTDDEMKEFGFSTEEYELIQEITTTQHITVGDLKPQGFHDLIRLRMKTVDRISPLQFLEEYANGILEAYKFREMFIEEAWQEVRQNGPIVYPENVHNENIFEAKGRWETWSSPSSDVDRRNKYFYLADWFDYAVRWFEMKPSFIDLAGLEKYNIQSQAQLAQALTDEKNRVFAQKSMAYKNSKGQMIPLTLTEIEKRLYDLSFDPNHPPELRWGAPMGSPERASAPQTYTPLPDGSRLPMEEAYRLEYFYRTCCQRETESSYLRRMFTSGFPIREKLDAQVAKWLPFTEPPEALRKKEPKEPVHILVPHVMKKEGEQPIAPPKPKRPRPMQY
jgi:hypothetical protein